MEVYNDKGKPVIRWIAAILLGVLFLILSVLAGMNQMGGMDNPILQLFVGARTAGATVFWKLITLLADTWVLTVFCACLIVFPVRFKLGIPVTAATFAAGLLHALIKAIVGRPRPETIYWLAGVGTSSFPSGHANASVVFYLLLMTILRRYFIIKGSKITGMAITVIAPAIVALVGISRMYLGVHYFSDVIGGWILGSILLIVFITLYDYVWPAKWRITYQPPAWKDPLRKKPEWRHPVPEELDKSDMVEFPKVLKPWRQPTIYDHDERPEDDPTPKKKNEKYTDAEEFIPLDDGRP